jgi:hypothetical protein
MNSLDSCWRSQDDVRLSMMRTMINACISCFSPITNGGFSLCLDLWKTDVWKNGLRGVLRGGTASGAKNLRAEPQSIIPSSFRLLSRVIPECFVLHGQCASLRLHLRRLLCSNIPSSRSSTLQSRFLGLPLQFSL